MGSNLPVNPLALCVDNLSVGFGDTRALQDVSFSARASEFVLLAGPSGSGKSTLLRCLNGLIPNTIPARKSGRVLVLGLDTREHAVSTLARKVGLVFQNPEAQFFNLTVRDEVLFGPNNLGLPSAAAQRQAMWALEAAGAAHLEDRRLDTLSGGEKQCVAIASVLALRPSLLALDEPTAHLDVPSAMVVLNTLTRLCREEGIAILLGEHRTGAVGRIAGRMLLLDGGRIVADGLTREVFERRELIRSLGVRRPADEPEQGWESLIGESSPLSGLPPLAELRGVEAGYGGRRVLRGVDLAVYPGEVVALVGDNGAGKTTVARLLAGLLAPTKGDVLVGGRKPRPTGEGVGLVLQNPMAQLFCETVEEEVSFGPANLGLPANGEVGKALACCDLLPLLKRPVHRLSCGQQQRTVVAGAMTLGPRLLILDEPTMGQDWGHLAAMMGRLTELARQGQSLLLITHDYKLVHRYADRVILLKNGRVEANGRPRNRIGVNSNPKPEV